MFYLRWRCAGDPEFLAKRACRWCAEVGQCLGGLLAVGNGEQAARHLEVYAGAFVSRNGFHINGDRSRLGDSSYTYRSVTPEGNFAASWRPQPCTANRHLQAP